MANAAEKRPWFGSWKPKRLICPFACSDTMKTAYEKSKTLKFEFADDKIVDPSGMGLNCLLKPDYSGLKATTARRYLMEWSNNEEANTKPEVKVQLPKTLGLQNDTQVTAGIIHCGGQGQNLIFVNSKQAFARYEENAYWELSR